MCSNDLQPQTCQDSMINEENTAKIFGQTSTLMLRNVIATLILPLYHGLHKTLFLLCNKDLKRQLIDMLLLTVVNSYPNGCAIFSLLILMGLFLSTPPQSSDLCNVAGMKSAAQGVEIWLSESQTDEEACFNH